jgi:DNA-binding transcriptional LysR family regulator
MEMHQVRYFLAVARTLNFTRAADECNVTQPSLTRAIQQLEQEFGGDLFRRERPHAQLTELGQRMLPLLQQCHDSATSASSLASLLKRGEISALRVALSHTVALSALLPCVIELRKRFKDMELKILRGTPTELLQLLRDNAAELAIASSIEAEWERLDRWALYSETFDLVASRRHRLAGRDTATIDDLRNETLLTRSYCEHAATLMDWCRKAGLSTERSHELSSRHDLVELLEQEFGVALAPQSEPLRGDLMRMRVEGLDVRRTVFLYGVAGRQRTPVGMAVMNYLRAADWSKFTA